MIRKIYANNKGFKAVEFSSGLNIVLADKKTESGKKDSRNGLGKTTLLNVVHFCLGADLKKQFLPVDALQDWEFYIEMDIAGHPITASRSIKNPSLIRIQGDTSSLPLSPEIDEETNDRFYKLDNWKELLGIEFFSIPSSASDKYSPSFRNLISYFVRRGADAYNEPFSYFRGQPTWSVQVHNAFLLGLNWRHASSAQEIKDKSGAINSLTAAIKTGIVSSQGELEAERVRLEKELTREHEALSEFKVYPQYQEVQNKANSLTKIMHEVTNNNLMLRRRLERYEDSVKEERPPETNILETLYAEAGLNFGDAVKKTLQEAKQFHGTIIENRKTFLCAEISQIRNQIDHNEQEIAKHSEERASLLKILQSHGALEEYTRLQEKFAEKKAFLEAIKAKIADIRDMSERKKSIKAEKIELETKLQRDYEDARPKWEKAVSGFNENSQALYHEAGNLIINVSESGYSFKVEIPRSSSEGVSKMKIFCYDLMLVDLFSSGGGVDFLLHDSTIFDSVDSRQIALALEHAHNKAIKSGFQYICTFNSDKLPSDGFGEKFNIKEHIRLTLTDKDPKDSLMGFRYNE